MKRMPHGLCVVLGMMALGCGTDPHPLLDHGVDTNRRLSSLSEDEAFAVCEVNNGQNSIGRQLFAMHSDSCVAAAVQHTQSRVDCAEFAYECIRDGEADIFLRSVLQGASCENASERFSACDASIEELERCVQALWVVGDDAIGMGRAINRCNTRIQGEHESVRFDACAADPIAPGEGGGASLQGCSEPVRGCEAFGAGACRDLLCDAFFLGSGAPHRSAGFCQ